MPLDPNLILQGKGVQLDNPLDVAQKAQTLKSMATQNKAQEQALSANEQQRTLENVARLTANVKDQPSYDSALQEAAGMGMDISQLPKQYDPNLIRGYQARALTALQRLQLENDQQNRQESRDERRFLANQNHQYKMEELRAKREERAATKEEKASEGIRALDKDFAKDFNEWTSGGSASAKSEIEKLKGVIGNLRSKKVTTGGLTGVFPDQLTSDAVLSARADVNSTVMNSLRSILGAQFTEKEGERIIKNTWNEADSTENNMARLQRLVSDLSTKAAEKDRKSVYFQNNKSLSGFDDSTALRETVAGAGSKGSGATENWGATDYDSLNDDELIKQYKERVLGAKNANSR